jgi:osmotically-inducible protein OsmY
MADGLEVATMEYARVELRLVSGGWSHGVLIEGAVGDGPRGVVVRPSDLVVTHTLVKPSRRASLPNEQIAGDARTPISGDLARITHGASLVRGSHAEGRITALWCDRATGRIRHVLVRSGGGFLRRGIERVAAVEMLQGAAKDSLILADDAPPLSDLPHYRPDTDIAADVRSALAYAIPSPTVRRAVNCHIEDGQVHLSGVLEREDQVEAVRRAVTRVKGVHTLVVDLVSLETLAARVEQQLAPVLAANGAAPGDVRVLAEHGIIHLDTSVTSPEVRKALDRAARTVPGVRVVINNHNPSVSMH